MKTFKVELILTVPNNWIEDGFNLEEWREEIEKHLPYTLLSVIPTDFYNELTVKTKITNCTPINQRKFKRKKK